MFLLVLGASAQSLSSNFYATCCPNALSTIKSAVTAAVNMEARMGASLVKIHFHDCFVNGCDGSVLLDDTWTFTGEKTAVPNKNSLRGFDTIKTNVEAICKQTVSCADTIAVSARVALGGPTWEVQLGRRDSKTASLATANSDIPSPSSSISALISAFSKKGLSATDMVALSGAHTIGQARCTVFRTRLIIDISPRAVKPLFRPAMSSFVHHQCANRGRSYENGMPPVPTTRTWGARRACCTRTSNCSTGAQRTHKSIRTHRIRPSFSVISVLRW